MSPTSSLILPTLILRHRKENLKKCSLRGLEGRSDLSFFTYPSEVESKGLPCLKQYITLSLEGAPLSMEDADYGILLIDGTWRYAEVMGHWLEKYHACHTSSPLLVRSIPHEFRTAYPRKQTSCHDPARGLASVEALYIAHHILGRNTEGLLSYYHWKDSFLSLNTCLKKP